MGGFGPGGFVLAARSKEIEDETFSLHESLTQSSHLTRNFIGDRRDAITVTVYQISWIDRDPTYMHRHIDVDNVTVSVSTDGSAGEDGEVNCPHLVQIMVCSRR